MSDEKPLLILRSDLSNPPRYYATKAYTVLDDKGHIRVTGKKWDVTDQINLILLQARSYPGEGDKDVPQTSAGDERLP